MKRFGWLAIQVQGFRKKRERGTRREVERIRAKESLNLVCRNKFLLCQLGVGDSYQNEISSNYGLAKGHDLLKEMW